MHAIGLVCSLSGWCNVTQRCGAVGVAATASRRPASRVKECNGSAHAGLAFSPISPYQLLERVDVNVIGVHVVNHDIALPEISLVYLIGVPSAG
jgi:hypothetical protein